MRQQPTSAVARPVPKRRGVGVIRQRPLPYWTHWIGPVAFVVVWEIAARGGFIDKRIVPPPSEIVVTLAKMVWYEHFLDDISVTLMRFLAGVTLGVVAGTVIGLTMGLFRWPRVVLHPLVSMFYPLPHIALFPIVLILVGQNEYSNLLMITLGPFFTMIILSANAVGNIEPIFIDVAKSFETDLRDLYVRIIFPAVLPQLAAGLRISLGLALISTIAVEFLVADDGIGHVIWNSWTILSLARSVAGLVVTGLIGFVAFSLFSACEKRIIPWQIRNR